MVFPHTVAPRRCAGWGAAGVSAPPYSAWHPRMTPGAAPQSTSPSPTFIIVPTLCGTSSSLLPKNFGPLLTVPRCQGKRQAVYCFIMAPVDVFEYACQHGAPLVIPRQLWLTPYKQGSVVDGPSKVLKVTGVIQVHPQHGIWHTIFSNHPLHSVQHSAARLRISYTTTSFSSTPYGILLDHKCRRAHPGHIAAFLVCSPPA